MLAIKPGVRVLGLETEILLALMVARDLWSEQSQSLVVTSITDGQHKVGSLHYAGRAMDLRLPTANKERMVEQLGIRLGGDYDVILEGDHIHVEYDPKRPMPTTPAPAPAAA